jgi:transcriptional regulator with XRE-family HTH domain
MSVNEKIRLIRETKGFTQEQVAEKLAVSPSVYGDIERGENDPKLSRLQKIAEIFGVQLPELIDLSDEGVLNINFNQKGKQRDIYVGLSSSHSIELKNKEIVLKDKEIAMLQREVEQLNKIIELLEERNKP